MAVLAQRVRPGVTRGPDPFGDHGGLVLGVGADVNIHAWAKAPAGGAHDVRALSLTALASTGERPVEFGYRMVRSDRRSRGSTLPAHRRLACSTCTPALPDGRAAPVTWL